MGITGLRGKGRIADRRFGYKCLSYFVFKLNPCTLQSKVSIITMNLKFSLHHRDSTTKRNFLTLGPPSNYFHTIRTKIYLGVKILHQKVLAIFLFAMPVKYFCVVFFTTNLVQYLT